MKALSKLGNHAEKIAALLAVLLAVPVDHLLAQNGCTPPPSGLVAWWQGESNAVDIVGGNDGVLESGVAFDAGKVGQAFVFNGTNQWVEIPDSPALDPTNALTLEAWVYVSGYPNTDLATIITKFSPTDSTQNQYQLETHYAGGRLNFRPLVNLPSGYGLVDGKTTIQFNTWYHVAMTYDGATLSLYVNGALDGSVAASGVMVPTKVPLRIGGPSSGPWWFKGQVDEVSLYDRSLSANEIAAIYNAGAAGKCVPPIACTPPPAGLVAWWQAESNAQDEVGLNNGSLVSGASFTSGEVGTGFSFNGTGQFVEIPDSPSLRLTNEFTVELWYKDTGGTAGHYYGLLAKRAPYPSGCNYGIDMLAGPSGLLQVYIQDPNYGGYLTSVSPVPTPGIFHHVAATYRQAAAEQVELKTFVDGQLVQTGMVSGNLARTLNNAPVTIGTDDPNETYFVGIIDEPTIYSRALSATEIQAIYNAGSAGKCAGSIAPSIATQPSSQTVYVGNPATFSVVAAGSVPLSYQWLFNQSLILDATNSSLTISNASLAYAGSYAVVVTNVVGAITSSPAVLTLWLPPASVQLGAVTLAQDGTVTVPVDLVANGNENSVGFSLNFDPSLLTNTGVVLGSGGAGASLFPNLIHAASGQIGVVVGLPAGSTFAAGTQEVVVVSFASPIVTSATSNVLTFGDSPVKRVLADAFGNPLAATFNSGNVLLPATPLEGDVYPRPNGDEALTVSDWVLVGRYVAGLDSPTNALEFQKADCAPRDTLGDGQLTVSDWVQAGRYVAGLDPLTRAGGPTGPTPGVVPSASKGAVAPRTKSSARQVRLTAPALLRGQTGTVQVQLEAQGNENALAFSLNFNPAELTYLGASAATGANGVILNVNDRQATQGRLGLVLALQANQSFAPGTKQLVNVSFRATAVAAGNTAITFGDQPVSREVADPVATVLAADYINAAVAVSPLPALRITSAGQSVSLSWPTSATGFTLQESTDSRAWTAVTASPSVVNTENVVSVPPSASAKFYRLYQK